MADDISKIIAAVNPDLYHSGNKGALKKLIKEKGMSAAIKEAKPSSIIDFEIVYDSPSETLEPVYFWVLDMMNNLFGGNVEKLVDSFSSSPGSGYFSDFNMKKTAMQKNVTENLGLVNTVIKSIVNIIYDLKDFEIRLEHYENARSKDKNRAEAGNLALKQIWMDNVDIKRGNGSINALASGSLQFVTLRDAFMVVNSAKEVEKADLNERVKRILAPRIEEFNHWKELSEVELKKRFSIEKNYLKSQVNTLQLYSRWVKPYLKAASDLEMSDNSRNPALVNSFSTVWLELTLFGKNKFDFEDAILSRSLPKASQKPKRDYYACLLVDFKFRGIPQKSGQHFTLGGRANVTFKAFVLNDEELALLNEELKKSDITDTFKLIEGATTESIEELKKDIDYFLKTDEEKSKEKESKESSSGGNPFSALFSGFSFSLGSNKKTEKKIPKNSLEIKKDSYIESAIRKMVADTAAELCFTVYDVYKKSHGMASYDSPWE